jgi:hypothetical protein
VLYSTDFTFLGPGSLRVSHIEMNLEFLDKCEVLCVAILNFKIRNEGFGAEETITFKRIDILLNFKK